MWSWYLIAEKEGHSVHVNYQMLNYTNHIHKCLAHSLRLDSWIVFLDASSVRVPIPTIISGSGLQIPNTPWANNLGCSKLLTSYSITMLVSFRYLCYGERSSTNTVSFSCPSKVCAPSIGRYELGQKSVEIPNKMDLKPISNVWPHESPPITLPVSG